MPPPRAAGFFRPRGAPGGVRPQEKPRLCRRVGDVYGVYGLEWRGRCILDSQSAPASAPFSSSYRLSWQESVWQGVFIILVRPEKFIFFPSQESHYASFGGGALVGGCLQVRTLHIVCAQLCLGLCGSVLRLGHIHRLSKNRELNFHTRLQVHNDSCRPFPRWSCRVGIGSAWFPRTHILLKIMDGNYFPMSF